MQGKKVQSFELGNCPVSTSGAWWFQIAKARRMPDISRISERRFFLLPKCAATRTVMEFLNPQPAPKSFLPALHFALLAVAAALVATFYLWSLTPDPRTAMCGIWHIGISPGRPRVGSQVTWISPVHHRPGFWL